MFRLGFIGRHGPIKAGGVPTPPPVDNWLLESGENFLLEDGSYFLVEV